MKAERTTNLYGLLAEFEDARDLLGAARRAREAGYRKLRAYTPFPVKGLADLVEAPRKNWIPAIVFIGGVIGGLTGFFMQYFYLVWHYPLNVGGRPLNSWQAFIPITFELTILGAAVFGAVGMLWLSGLPRLFHPVFTVPEFRAATNDKFFLCVRASDAKFDPPETREFLESLAPVKVIDVWNKKR